MFLVLIFGFILPILAHYNVFFHKLLDIVGLPVASMGLAIGFLIISLIHNWTVYNILKALPYLQIDELREFLSAVAFAVLLYETSLLVEKSSKSDKQGKKLGLEIWTEEKAKDVKETYFNGNWRLYTITRSHPRLVLLHV